MQGFVSWFLLIGMLACGVHLSRSPKSEIVIPLFVVWHMMWPSLKTKGMCTSHCQRQMTSLTRLQHLSPALCRCVPIGVRDPVLIKK